MTAFACILAGSWLILACLGAFPIGRVLADRGTTTADREYVDWTPFDAPVPPPARAVNGWTAEVPADFLLDDDPELHDRFFAIVDADPELHERLIHIVSEWEWSE